jgi:hypothetical protein
MRIWRSIASALGRALSGAGTLDVCALAVLLRMSVSNPRLALKVSGRHQPAIIPWVRAEVHATIKH